MSNKNKKQEQDGEVRPLDALVIQTDVVISELSNKDLRRFCGVIDPEFLIDDGKLVRKRLDGSYFISISGCTWASYVRIYCAVAEPGIDKIEVLGYYTDSWQEIHPDTYERIDKFLKEEFV